MLDSLKRTVQAYGEDNAPLLAVALAYFSVFSLAPCSSCSSPSSSSSRRPGGALPWRTLNRLVAFSALVLVFALLFKLLPNAHVPWRATWIGATTTALLFVLGSWLFGVYIANVAVASAYGAAGSLVLLLLWVYVSAQMFLLGAELTHVLARRVPGAETIAASQA